MDKINKEEELFRRILSESKLNVPFSDFEENVMTRIIQMEKRKKASFSEFRLARIFFVIGSMLGIIVSMLLPKMQGTFWGMSPEKLTLLFQVVFAFLFFTQLDNLKKFYREHRNKLT